MADIQWLLERSVIVIHQQQIAEHGGSPGIRDLGLLQSALARPQNLLAYSEQPPDIASLAAAYAYGIVRNHAFVDGNKRTGFVALRTFLLLNGSDINAPKEERYLTFIQLAEGNLSEDELAAWTRQNLIAS